MALRLLPAFNTDNDDDDDGNFTKWMSSYWGHGAEGSRDRKRIRRPAGAASASRGDRRASLPTVSQLDAMKLNRLHAASMASGSGPVKTREEGGEARNHQRARRASSDDNSRSKSAIPENRISTIPELAESFERRLFLRDKRTTCLNDDDKSCRICHEDMKKSGGAVHELHCSHHVHREASRRPEGRLAHSEACQARRFSNERRRSADGPLYLEREELTPQRQLSLRSHR
ncbi:leukemia NUP98 fusion partner 1 [Cyclopterus lumpus]|uniref:leukemia NUP98 fusion partner 1 n=1 Tax=Cyclopterus lumpus TaxID=8103 RepID=UPI001486D0B9|nr:leukemia NUP98 fusion partner 1 [Cyclopterus lumpus]